MVQYNKDRKEDIEIVIKKILKKILKYHLTDRTKHDTILVKKSREDHNRTLKTEYSLVN